MEVKAYPKRVVIDIDIVADVEWHHPYFRAGDIDALKRSAKERCDELNNTVKGVRFRVVELVEEQCSACGHKWEIMPPDNDDPNGVSTCSWCGDEVA